MAQANISLNNINYSLPDGREIINNLSLNFQQGKIAVVGRNGVGKSTLFKLIAAELMPAAGDIHVIGKVYYCPQDMASYGELSVVEFFSVKDKLLALQKIESGDYQASDLQTIADNWTVKHSIEQQLIKFNLSYVDLEDKLSRLSGGELTRLFLAKAVLQDADFTLLDEPTNNLDKKSKELLYNIIRQWKKRLLVISHDRELLNLMDAIIELTSLGATIYGGDYEFYVEQKQLQQQALQKQVEDADKLFSKAKRSVQSSREKHARRAKKSKALARCGSIDKMAAGSMKGHAEKTQGRMLSQHEKMIMQAEQRLSLAKEKLEITDSIKIKLNETRVPTGKLILDIEDLSFTYPQQSNLIKNFNLKLHGAQRIAIIGDNGSGKTTLIKLILGEFTPDEGSIHIGVKRVSYLDQQAQLLHPEQSILHNFKLSNPEINDNDAYAMLAQFMFKNVQVLKLVKQLSGGEKLRALLAATLMAKQPPQLIILDEPTNHLDLESINSIEKIINLYQGALIVISHDHYFLENIGVNQTIAAPFR